MTPEEFAAKMLEASQTTYTFDGRTYPDRETAHEKMDALMCNLLRSLGYGDAMNIFELSIKWYA